MKLNAWRVWQHHLIFFTTSALPLACNTSVLPKHHSLDETDWNSDLTCIIITSMATDAFVPDELTAWMLNAVNEVTSCLMPDTTQSNATPSHARAQLAPSAREAAALKAEMDAANYAVDVKDAALRCLAGVLADLIRQTATSDDKAHEVFGKALDQRLSQDQRRYLAERRAEGLGDEESDPDFPPPSEDVASSETMDGNEGATEASADVKGSLP